MRGFFGERVWRKRNDILVFREVFGFSILYWIKDNVYLVIGMKLKDLLVKINLIFFERNFVLGYRFE